VKGHRYLDDAGKIMNHWDSEFPTKEVGLDGLLMTNPHAILRDLRIDNRTIWIHLRLPEAVKQVVDLSMNITEQICEIIDVKQFGRLGLRLNFIHDLGDSSNMLDIVGSNLFSSECLQLAKTAGSGGDFDFALLLGTKDVSLNLRVATVRKKPDVKLDKELPESGVLLDVDIFREGTSFLDDMKRFGRLAKDWVDDELPKIENTLFARR
jgi:hypothetical protein